MASKCSTCVKARDWLSAHGVAHDFVDYRDHPVAAATLKAWAGKVGGWEKLVNRTSMTWRALPDERKAASTDAQWTQLIAEYPALVRRPVTVTPDGEVTVGFSESATANASPDRAAPWPGKAIPSGSAAGAARCFDRDARELARDPGQGDPASRRRPWLSARIIETEAYYQAEKGSHASLGYTHKRRALFMDGGVIYMYYARGGDSLNFSAAGPGNAVLIKSGHPWVDARSGPEALARMQALNPDAAGRASAAQAVRRPDAAVPRPGLESAGLGCAPLRPGRCTWRTWASVPPPWCAAPGWAFRRAATSICNTAMWTRPMPRSAPATRCGAAGSRVATTSGWMGGTGNCRRRAGRSGRSACSARQAPADVRALRQAPFQAERSAASRARRSIEASISAYFCRTRRRFRRRLQAYSGIRGSEPKPSIRYSPGLPSALRP